MATGTQTARTNDNRTNGSYRGITAATIERSRCVPRQIMGFYFEQGAQINDIVGFAMMDDDRTEGYDHAIVEVTTKIGDNRRTDVWGWLPNPSPVDERQPMHWEKIDSFDPDADDAEVKTESKKNTKKK